MPGWRKGLSGVLSLISLLGLALSVFGLITVMSVMNGFERELQSRMLTLLPHAKLLLEHPVSDNWPEIARQLDEQSSIDQVSPFIEGRAIFKQGDAIVPIQLNAVDTGALGSLASVEQAIFAGELSSLETFPFGVVIGSQAARKLRVSLGDRVTIIMPRVYLSPLGPIVRERQLTVVGLFEVGAEIDATLALTNLETGRKLLGKRQTVDGLRLQTDDRFQVERIVKEAIAGIDIKLENNSSLVTWKEENAALYAAVVMERIMIFALLICVVAVASFSIVAIVLMSVLEKQTQIAIMRTMGASQSQVRRAFLLQGLIVGVIGVSLGAFAAILVAPNLSALIGWLESVIGWQLFDPQVYYIAYLPSVLMWRDVVVVSAVAISMSVLVSVFPAGRAAKIDPVIALASARN